MVERSRTRYVGVPALTENLVDNQQAFDDALRDDCDILGIDTEFIRVNTFYPIPALYQLAHGSQITLVDAQAKLDYTTLETTLLDPLVTKIMHACSEDLEVLQHHLAVRPRGLVDTQIAHAFLKPEFSLSYAGLVEGYLGVELTKQSTRSNWLKRPLSKAQLEYAVDDVLYLPELWSMIRSRLEQQGRYAWFTQEMSRMLEQPIVSAEEYYRTVKGAWRLQPRQLSILRSLVTWRELEARDRDVPRSKTVWDTHLMKLAQSESASVRMLERMLPPGITRSYANAVLRAFDEGKSTTQLPEPLPRPFSPHQGKIVKLLRDVASETADRLGMAVELLGRKRDVETCVRHYETQRVLPSWFNGWRDELVGDSFLQILSGQLG